MVFSFTLEPSLFYPLIVSYFSYNLCKLAHNTFMKKNMITNFFLCGLTGWCMECFWTGLHSIIGHEDKKLTCNTSVWMFPIYGMAAFLSPISRLLKNTNTFIRGGVYTFCIFLAEYGTGKLLKKHNACPWDYSASKLNYKGLIRLDYAPVWFIVGLFYEKLIGKKTA